MGVIQIAVYEPAWGAYPPPTYRPWYRREFSDRIVIVPRPLSRENAPETKVSCSSAVLWFDGNVMFCDSDECYACISEREGGMVSSVPPELVRAGFVQHEIPSYYFQDREDADRDLDGLAGYLDLYPWDVWVVDDATDDGTRIAMFTDDLGSLERYLVDLGWKVRRVAPTATWRDRTGVNER